MSLLKDSDLHVFVSGPVPPPSFKVPESPSVPKYVLQYFVVLPPSLPPPPFLIYQSYLPNLGINSPCSEFALRCRNTFIWWRKVCCILIFYSFWICPSHYEKGLDRKSDNYGQKLLDKCAFCKKNIYQECEIQNKYQFNDSDVLTGVIFIVGKCQSIVTSCFVLHAALTWSKNKENLINRKKHCFDLIWNLLHLWHERGLFSYFQLRTFSTCESIFF